MKHDINLLDGSIFTTSLRLTIPIALTEMLQYLLNITDSIIVGQFVGETEFAAVGSTTMLINFLTCLCVGLSVGANILVAKQIGKKDLPAVSRTVHTAVSLSILSGCVSGALLFFFAEFFLGILKTPSDILPVATVYLKWIAAGIPGLIIFNFGTAILRAKGDTVRPLVILVLTGLLRIVFNLLFILLFNLGVLGSGLAFMVSQLSAAGLTLYFLLNEESAVKLRFRKLKISRKEMIDIVSVGIPAGIQSIIFWGSNLLMQAAVNSFGSTTIIAGNAAAANVEGFVEQSMIGSYYTVQVMTGQNFGAGNFERIKKGLNASGGIVICIGITFSCIAYFFAEQLLSVFTKETATIQFGTLRMTYLLLPLFLCGYMDVVLGAIRGLGHSFLAMMISLITVCVVRVAWIYTVFARAHTPECLYISFPISWILATVTALLCFHIVFRKEQRNYN